MFLMRKLQRNLLRLRMGVQDYGDIILTIFMMQAMFKRGLIKHFHLELESLNTCLVEQFETGSDTGSVTNIL